MKEAFFVTPIGEENSDERKRADNILEYVLTPTLGEAYKIVRADKIDAPGNINHDIVQRLYNADLVIADLTGFNPNVMYEIGVRHSFNRPIIQLAQKDQKLPFDVATERTIFFDLNDVESVSKAKPKIKSAADEALKKVKSYRSPIYNILNTAAVFNEGGDVAEAIESLSDQVENINENVWDALQSAVEVSGSNHLESSMEDQISYIYQIVSALRPYDADRLIAKLRQL